jgi:hypothetical protein
MVYAPAGGTALVHEDFDGKNPKPEMARTQRTLLHLVLL